MTAPTPTPNAMPGATPAPPAAAPPAAPEPPPVAAAAPAIPAGAPPAPPADPATPPWGSDENFNPKQAWDLIQNLRGELDGFDPDKKVHNLREEIKNLAAKNEAAKPILAEHEALRRASQTEQDRLREDLTAATGREQTWRNQAIRAQAEQMATGKFVSTKAAVAMIGDLSEFGTPEGIDLPKLQARLDQLAAEEPNLVAPQGAPGFTPNRGQGQSGTGQIPLDAQIKAAQERGDFATSIALQQQKLIKK